MHKTFSFSKIFGGRDGTGGTSKVKYLETTPTFECRIPYGKTKKATKTTAGYNLSDSNYFTKLLLSKVMASFVGVSKLRLSQLLYNCKLQG